MVEIEELATKQGEEEARRLKQSEEKKVVNVDDLSQNERKYNLKKIIHSELYTTPMGCNMNIVVCHL